MNENDIENDLQQSRKWIDTEDALVIKAFLDNLFPDGLQVFVLHHHFGQAEEYFTLMVNAEFIVDLEYVKSEVVEHDIYPLNVYLAENKKMPSTFKRTINIAKKLADGEIASSS